jgi:hypothetical protein
MIPTKLQNACLNLATLYGLASGVRGVIITTGAALLVALSLYGMACLSFSAAAVTCFILMSTAVVVHLVACKNISQEKGDELALHHIVGLVVAFLFIPVGFKYKIIITAALLYHIIMATKPALLFQRPFTYLRWMPRILYWFMMSIVVGVVVNLTIHLAVWISY